MNESNDPPMLIVLKREGIRNFAGGKRVALYKNTQLNIEFSIPYDAQGTLHPATSTSIKEDVDSDDFSRDEIVDCLNTVYQDLCDKPNKSELENALYNWLNSEMEEYGDFEDMDDEVLDDVYDDYKALTEDIEYVTESHKHKFTYLGGEAKCDCGKYLQPDGRITDTASGGVNESAMHHINRIMNAGKEDRVIFRNGGSVRVHPVTAKAILDLHKKVNSSNQSKLSALINSSPRGLEKVAKFAMQHVAKKK